MIIRLTSFIEWKEKNLKGETMITIVGTKNVPNVETTGESSLTLPSNHILVVKDRADNEYQIATNEETCSAVQEVLSLLAETQVPASLTA